MNKIKVIASVIVVGIISGVAVGYCYKQNNNTPLASKVDCCLASFTDEDMASMASDIVKGNVVSISEPKWNTPDEKQPSPVKFEDMLYKEVAVNLDQVYKGGLKKDSTIKIKVYGGTYSDNGQPNTAFEDVAAKFAKDENVIMFLGPDDSQYNKNKSNDYYVVLGSKQGKYTTDGEQVESAVRKLSKKELESKIEGYENAEPRIKKGTGKI